MLLHSARLIEHPPWWKGSAQAHADLPPTFSCLLDGSDPTSPNPEVLHRGRDPPVTAHFCWCFSFTPLLIHEPWQIWIPPFSTLSLIWNKVRRVSNTHSLHCSPLTIKFQRYNIDATYFDAFRYKNIAAARLRICSVFYFTENFKWSLNLFSLPLHAAPRTPCSSRF